MKKTSRDQSGAQTKKTPKNHLVVRTGLRAGTLAFKPSPKNGSIVTL